MRLLVLTLLVAVLLFGCASPQAPPKNEGAMEKNDSTVDPKDGAMMGKEVVIEITAKQFEFSPSTITVKKGDKVKLKITSQDVTHGFSLPDFGVSANLQPGVTTEAVFTADKTGEFQFRCSVFCGTGHSTMAGKLVVTE